MGLLVASAVIALILLIGGGAYSYWIGLIGNRQGSVAQAINSELTTAGFDGLAVSVSKDWVATVTGAVTGQEKHVAVIALIKSHSDIKQTNDQLEVNASTAELQQQLESALISSGLRMVQGTVGDDYVVTLTGTVDEERQQAKAVAIAQRLTGVKDVVDQLQRSMTWRQRELTRTMMQVGLSTVAAILVDENTVTLTGTVASESERSRAQQVAMEAANAPNVRNSIQVTVPQSTAVNVAPRGKVVPQDAPQSTAQAREVAPTKQLAGLWVGNVRQLIMTFTVNLRLRQGQVGDVIGETSYGVGKNVDCSGVVTLIESAENAFVLEEKITKRAGLLCGGGGTIRMQLQGPRNADLAWYRAKSPTKVSVKGSVVRQ